MNTINALISFCLLFTSYAVLAENGSAEGDKVLKASKMLNGQQFSIRLSVKPLPESFRQKEGHHNPISGSWVFTDSMVVSYGGKKIDVYPETYLHLLDPINIHSVEVAPNKMLSFQIMGSDAAATYNYRFYVDPVVRRLVRVDHVWPADGIGGPGIIEKYKTKPMKVKSYTFKETAIKQ
jgi:hypothetical protein